MKRIHVDAFDNGASIIIEVTVPTVFGSKTFDVAISDELARDLVQKVQNFLDRRGAKRLGT